MKIENIISVVNKIESETIQDDAYLGAFYLDYGSDERYIKANKNGILKFVVLLLNSLKDFDFHLEKKDHYAIINLKKEDWFDKKSTISIDWIEPTNKTRQEIIKKDELQQIEKQKKWIIRLFDDAIGYLIFGLIIISLVVGFISIVGWLIKLFS